MSSRSLLSYLLEQLQALPAVSARSVMRGGFALGSGGVVFGLVTEEAVYFRTSPETVTRYLACGMFRFRGRGNAARWRGFFMVPTDVLRDPEALLRWAAEAVEAGRLRPRGRVRALKRPRRPGAGGAKREGGEERTTNNKG